MFPEGNRLWPKHVVVRLDYAQTDVCVVVVYVLGSSIRQLFAWPSFTRLGRPQRGPRRFGELGNFAGDRSRIKNSEDLY
jgi:hypothetical protein